MSAYQDTEWSADVEARGGPRSTLSNLTPDEQAEVAGHVRYPEVSICRECRDDWPCPTVRMAERLSEAVGLLADVLNPPHDEDCEYHKGGLYVCTCNGFWRAPERARAFLKGTDLVVTNAPTEAEVQRAYDLLARYRAMKGETE